jgi:hypothetical protein
VNIVRKFGLAVFAIGCAGTDLDLGNDASPNQLDGASASGGTGGTGGTGATPPSPLPTVPPQTGCTTDPGLESLVGTWEGNVEDFYLRPVEHLRIVINGISATEGVCGSLTWGTREGPPPAADPETLYPSPDYWTYSGGGGGNLPPIEGFSYTLVDGGARLPAVRLGVASNEPWHSFCQLQTPVPVSGGFDCMQSGYTVDPYPRAPDAECVAGGVTHTAFRCLSCSGPSAELHCQCNEERCVAGPDRDVRLELSLATDGKSLSGPFNPNAAEYHYPSLDGARWPQGVSIYLERVE